MKLEMPDTIVRAPTRGPVAAVYAAAFLQGLALVSFPASGAVLKGTLGLSDAQYGSIFLPQVALAIAGAFGGGALARRLGLRMLLAASLLAIAASQLALAGALWVPVGARLVMVSLGTALLGLGFGLGGAPLNGYAAQFFPARRDTALVALHSLVGLGLAAGPLVLAALAAGNWVMFPLCLAGAAALLAAMAIATRFPAVSAAGAAAPGATRGAARSPAFWVLALIAVLYAFAEGTFSNWTVVYLTEVRHLPPAVAGLALSLFWGSLVAGRLLVSLLVLRIPARRVWLALPALMIAAFWLLPQVDSAATGVGFFGLAGLACSAFFPLTIALAAARFPDEVAWVSSMMIAALMAGVGLGSFLVGALRAALPLDVLYQVSSAWPAVALLLAVRLQRPAAVRGDPP